MPNVKVTMTPHCANVYHLMGTDENALSSALGHLMIVDAPFMLMFLKEADILGRVQGKSYSEYTSTYTVHLQEQKSGISGRRDVVLEAGGSGELRVVIECKIGKGSPTARQLLLYSVERGPGRKTNSVRQGVQRIWGHRTGKYLVSLTRDGLRPQVRSEVCERLSGTGIELRDLRWAQVLELAMSRVKQESIDIRSQIFLQEFANFFMEWYKMESFQAEVMVKKDDLFNTKNVYLDGCMYVGDERDIEVPLYFAPEFTAGCVGKVEGVGERGIHYISKVVRVVPTTAAQLKTAHEGIVDGKIKAHILWPRWQCGLRAIARRAKDERWPDKHRNQLYFLSEPARLPHRVITGLDQIPPGYKTTVIDLLTKNNLIED